jgi:NhaP-type Na+/H+ or K+/H+ antiporter
MLKKYILQSAIIGAIGGCMITLIYIITGIIFKETVFDIVLYYVSIFFAWPFGFLIKLLEETTHSYLGSMLGLFCASFLGGMLYGTIIGSLVSVIMCFMKRRGKFKGHTTN